MWWTKIGHAVCLATMLAPVAPPASFAHAAQTCPTRQGTRLQYVHLFDGPPEELAELEANVVGATTGYTDVSTIYPAHRQLYVQCEYLDHTRTTVVIRTPVRRCSYQTDAADTIASFICR